jgi:hypothetical protein
VTLVSVEPTVPQGVSSGSTPDALEFVFDISNSTDASLTVPGRPIRPEILGSDGSPLQWHSIGASLRNGGGGLGPASRGLGEPYLNPGGVMHVVVSVKKAATSRPFTVKYSPLGEAGVEFRVR